MPEQEKGLKRQLERKEKLADRFTNKKGEKVG
jgi:hypothetical protein